MKCWQLQITTNVDGRETVTERMGEVTIDGSSVKLVYAEESAVVTLTIAEKNALVKREGDYDLFLSLREGEKTDGSITLSGSQGTLTVKTDKVRCLIKDNASALLILQYVIYFGDEPQEMKLRLVANKRSD